MSGDNIVQNFSEAAIKGEANVVKKLLGEGGITPEIINEALDNARKNGFPEVVKIIEAYLGVSSDIKLQQPIEETATPKDSAPNVQNKEYINPVILKISDAIAEGNAVEIAKLLATEEGAKISDNDKVELVKVAFKKGSLMGGVFIMSSLPKERAKEVVNAASHPEETLISDKIRERMELPINANQSQLRIENFDRMPIAFLLMDLFEERAPMTINFFKKCPQMERDSFLSNMSRFISKDSIDYLNTISANSGQNNGHFNSIRR